MNYPVCSALLAFTLTLASPVTVSADSFSLNPEPAPDSLTVTRKVDVNLGESPQAFVTALWRQLTGETPPPDWVEKNAAKLGSPVARRRIDLALQVAAEAKVSPEWVYSDPWTAQVRLNGAPEKKVKRDVGAVFMFFFTSPKAPNGGPGWANNHVPGMLTPSEQLRFDLSPANGEVAAAARLGYYQSQNPGFWYQELNDARYAGLDFLLLNTYGPDLDAPNVIALGAALERIESENGVGSAIKLALFDDTWTWGEPYFGPFWQKSPDCTAADRTALLLYEAKWRPFFQGVPKKNWYLINGRPFITFYNCDKLLHSEAFASEVLPRMKALFKTDFGVEPFVSIDRAYDKGEASRVAADTGFQWYTFDAKNQRSTVKWHDVELTHSMVRWDSVSREAGKHETVATVFDVLHKDDRILIKLLDDTRDTNVLVIATWNDLGEGTGINRSYDYYWDGRWHAPDHFMQLIRRSQAGETLAP